jgi:hypothetical protein
MVYSKRNGNEIPLNQVTTLDDSRDQRLILTVQKIVKPAEITLKNDKEFHRLPMTIDD